MIHSGPPCPDYSPLRASNNFFCGNVAELVKPCVLRYDLFANGTGIKQEVAA